MAQMQLERHLPLTERQDAFYHSATLLYRVFPKQSDEGQNQLYRQWDECNGLLQQVLNLKDTFKEDLALADGSRLSTFCELLRDCQRYLYESNSLSDLDDVCKVNLAAAEALDNKEQATDITAWTLSTLASMYESTGRVAEAIELNMKGYNMRLAEQPLKGGLLAGFEQNLAYNYNTANQHETALSWFEKSRDTSIAWNIKKGQGSHWSTVTKKNTARCLVYLGQYSKAEQLLNTAIAEFKQEKILNWAMLAYAFFVQGTLQRKTNNAEAAEASFLEAQNLWSKGDQTRLHPFHAGCIYKTGVACLDQGKIEPAIKHLREASEITKLHADNMPVEHARCLFKLSEALLHGSQDNTQQAMDLRDEAKVYLLHRDADAKNFDTENAYDLWVPIFWR